MTKKQQQRRRKEKAEREDLQRLKTQGAIFFSTERGIVELDSFEPKINSRSVGKASTEVE